MIDFKAGEIRHIMPDNLLGPETRAISYALGNAMRRLQEFALGIHLCADLENVSDPVLNLMALELNTQYYDQTLPRKVREGLVAKAFLWHIRAGTPSVLTEYMKTVLSGGYIEEWMQYGGEPYHFKAYAQMSEEAVVPLGYGAEIRAQIDIYKNVRSWLEGLSFILTTGFHVDVKAVNRMTIFSEFYPRGNLAFLTLNQLWKLNGEKLLNGYQKDIEFYPSSLKIRSEVADTVFIDAKIKTAAAAWMRVKRDTRMGIRADVHESIRRTGRINFPLFAEAKFLSDAKFGMAAAVPMQIENNVEIWIRSEADEDIQGANRLMFPMSAAEKVNMQTHLRAEHDLWYLNGSCPLNGDKFLDAYIIYYD